MNWIYLYYAFLVLIILSEIAVMIWLWLNRRRLDRQFEAWKASQPALYQRILLQLLSGKGRRP